jgi:mRNA-degrading endonuclease RelE of RelBE toxin-antitoxin system
MTSPFSVRGTPRFDRLLRKLTRKHPDLSERFAEAFVILSTDPYNSSGSYPIRKLKGVGRGEGQYRLRLGRWRFRYDIRGQEVELNYCGLRREDTYRPS